LFWLDGHYSSGETAGAVEQNPILRELEAVAASDAGPHIVAIDDASDFSSAESNCTLSQVVAAAEHLGREYRVYFDYDILLALPDYGPSTDFWRHIAAPLVIR
jgi:hypothetical protein